MPVPVPQGAGRAGRKAGVVDSSLAGDQSRVRVRADGNASVLQELGAESGSGSAVAWRLAFGGVV